jgi:hypothetical protein
VIFKILLPVLSCLIYSNFIFADVVFDQGRRFLKEKVLHNHKPLTDYTEARHHLLGNVHLNRDERGKYYVKDVYCGHEVRQNVGPSRVPSHNIINVEHTWPQSRFNPNQSKTYQKSDLHHLYPTDSRANSMRANYYFTELYEGGTTLGEDCEESKLGRVQGTRLEGFEPPDNHKGNVARALFYFSIHYDIEIPDYEEVVLRQWHYLDPPDAEERERNDKIAKIQGNRNPFIDSPELVEHLSNY